jgi:ribosome-associated protein
MDIRKLQRAIVDGLEDVKAHDIVVFNTEALSPLFERVVIASGNSNRQTKALASSVRDAVKALGLPPPRIEGEENGEWIIVDCGAAVAHIMQPAVRTYYHLEEIWGVKPVSLKRTAPVRPSASPSTGAAAVTKGAPKAASKSASGKAAATKVAARKAAVKKAAAAKTSAAGTPARKPATAARKTAAPKAGAPKAVAPKAAATKVAATKAAARKSAAPKSAARKPAAPKAVAAKAAPARAAAPRKAAATGGAARVRKAG